MDTWKEKSAPDPANNAKLQLLGGFDIVDKVGHDHHLTDTPFTDTT